MPPYRALSLDLWFTTIYFDSADEQAWRDARVEALDHHLRTRADRPFGRASVADALERVKRELRAKGREMDVVPPIELVGAVVRTLAARVPSGLERASAAYSDSGLEAHPPRLADGVVRVAREFERRGIPVIAVTNTARPEATWEPMFRRIEGPRFRHIITSCEVGAKKPDPAIFRTAAERLGIPPAGILHVGDRWELDVVGARAGGLDAVVYRGLWARYPAAGYGDGSLPPNEGPAATAVPSVQRIDRLEELLETDRFEFEGP